MEQTETSPFLPIRDQEQVMMNIIAQGQYIRILDVISAGYKMTPLVFETLLRSGQRDIVLTILKSDFGYDGDGKYLPHLLEELMDKSSIGHFVVQKAYSKSALKMKSYWQMQCNSLSPQQLAENECWDTLLKHGQWEILAQHRRFDDIINTPYNNHNARAGSILERNHLYNRVAELGKFKWFVFMHKGEEYLFKYHQFHILYENKMAFKGWNSEQICKRICSLPEGREFFYKEDPAVLIKFGYTEIFQKNKRWEFLAQNKCFSAIDWNAWEKDIQKTGTQRSLDIFKTYVAQSQNWDLMIRNKMWFSLLKNKKFSLVFQQFLGFFKKAKSLR